MDTWTGLLHGFGQALSPELLLLALGGAVLGTLVGVLPGLGPIGAMSILLGLTSSLGPTASLVLFAAIYYGTMYGGSTTSILLNLPGESSSVVTAIEGHEMAKRGRAGAALAVAAVGSFIAGTVSIVGLMLFAPTLSRWALKIGPPEYVTLILAGLLLLVFMSPGSVVKALLMVGVGLAVATVGLDVVSATARYTFGVPELTQGLGFIPLVVGLFGIAEILSVISEKQRPGRLRTPGYREMFPTREERTRSVKPVARGSILGFLAGLVPGPAPVLATFASYTLEKKLSKHRDQFGSGAIEGVAGPEAANNASAAAAFVPLMALGIPFAPTMAVVLSALLLNGVVPGPKFINENPTLFWTVIASMYIGNIMLLVLNLPLVGVFARLITVPVTVLMPVVLAFTLVGVYAANNSMFDVAVAVVAGLVGFLLKRIGFSMAPLVLAVVLGVTLENSLRQSLVLSDGSLSIFVDRPISAAILAVLVAAGLWRVFTQLRQRNTFVRQPVQVEEF